MLGALYSYLSTLHVFPRLPLPPLSLYSAWSSQPLYYQRRIVIREHLHEPQWLRVSYWAFWVYIEGVWWFVLILSAVNIKRFVFQTMVKVLHFISFLDVGGKTLHTLLVISHYHFPSWALRRLLLGPWLEWQEPLLSSPYLVPQPSRCDYS